jgi:hypothetical protein
VRSASEFGGSRVIGKDEFDIRNTESRYLTRGWHFANAGFLEISHLWEINPKFLKIMIVGVLHAIKYIF